MRETKWTPGPWTVEPLGLMHLHVVNFDKRSIAMIPILGIYERDKENSALISAAPELYEALEMVRDADEDCKKDSLTTIPPMARSKIDRALAKACGEVSS